MNEHRKYFLAWIPPEPLYTLALEEKKAIAARYNTTAALRSPPHITLHMPFLWKTKKEQDLITALLRFAAREVRVTIQFDGYGCFTPRTIFWNVVKSENVQSFHYRLQRFCRTELQLFHSTYRDLPFHPHLTLAFRDLKKPAFAEAWAAVASRPFGASFEADRFVLLRHEDRQWQVFHEFLVA